MSDRVIRRILAPVELADAEPPDMGYAIQLAAQLGAELILFAVIDTPAMVSMIGHHHGVRAGGKDFQAGVVEDAKNILLEHVDAAAKAGVHALGHATVGESVVELILKEALVQKVDLILVRSPRRHGFMKHLLGSTAGEILNSAPCPVLVAPA